MGNSGQGVKLAVAPLLAELATASEITVCRESLEASENGAPPADAIPAAWRAPASRFAQLVEDCDRYVVF